jgi:hypothetical protein
MAAARAFVLLSVIEKVLLVSGYNESRLPEAEKNENIQMIIISESCAE